MPSCSRAIYSEAKSKSSQGANNKRSRGCWASGAATAEANPKADTDHKRRTSATEENKALTPRPFRDSMTSTLSLENHHGKVSTEKEGEKEGEGIRDIGNREGRSAAATSRYIGHSVSETACAEARAAKHDGVNEFHGLG